MVNGYEVLVCSDWTMTWCVWLQKTFDSIMSATKQQLYDTLTTTTFLPGNGNEIKHNENVVLGKWLLCGRTVAGTNDMFQTNLYYNIINIIADST